MSPIDVLMSQVDLEADESKDSEAVGVSTIQFEFACYTCLKVYMQIQRSDYFDDQDGSKVKCLVCETNDVAINFDYDAEDGFSIEKPFAPEQYECDAEVPRHYSLLL